MKNNENAAYLRRKKRLTIISVAVILVLAGLATWFLWNWLASFSDEGFRDYIRSFGAAGWLVLLALQFLQVFIALIPGEILETAAGYAFGPLWGTLICYTGVSLASALVFWLVRRFGVKLVEVFVDREKINGLRFLREDKKRNFLIFLLFLIPGTPKDLLTYFVGLTDIKFGTFMTISLVARIPSVLSSTIGGDLLGRGELWSAVWLYGITAALSLAGILIYNAILRHKKKNEKA